MSHGIGTNARLSTSDSQIGSSSGDRRVDVVGILTWLALVGFGLLGLSLLLFVVAFIFRTVQRVGVGEARPARRVVRYLSDGRQVADEGYTEFG